MSRSTIKIFILLFAISFLASSLKNTSAMPLGKFRLTCPRKNDSIYYDKDRPCTSDDDCETGLSPTFGCCHVPRKTEKFCLELIERESICAESKEKNIVFLVDGTVNYNQDFVEAAKDFQAIKDFVREIFIGLSSSKFGISIMQFGGPHDARTEINVSRGSDTDVLEKALISMKQMKGSERKIGEALAAASNKLYEMETLSYINGVNEEELIPGVVVLITRGNSLDIQETLKEIRIMKLKKIHVITVGVGPHTDGIIRELNELTCSSSDVFSARYNELPQIVDDVLRTICLGLRICAAESLSCENKKYDIYIAVDGSTSITERVFMKEKKLIRDLLVLLMSARSSDFSIGVMQFSEKAKTTEILPLGKNSLSQLQAVVEQMEFQSGKRTMLGDALTRIHRQVFNGSGEDRSDAENKVILFSDGVAHDFRTAKKEVEKLKKQGVEVITVFVGGHRPQLSNIASNFESFLDMKLTSLAQSAEYADKIESMICRSE